MRRPYRKCLQLRDIRHERLSGMGNRNREIRDWLLSHEDRYGLVEAGLARARFRVGGELAEDKWGRCIRISIAVCDQTFTNSVIYEDETVITALRFFIQRAVYFDEAFAEALVVMVRLVKRAATTNYCLRPRITCSWVCFEIVEEACRRCCALTLDVETYIRSLFRLLGNDICFSWCLLGSRRRRALPNKISASN